MMRIQAKKNNQYVVCKGDIFEISREVVMSKENGSTVIIPNICDNQNIFAGAFCAKLSQHYPIVKQNFHLLYPKIKLGHNQYIEVLRDKQYSHSLIVVNMFAQKGIKNVNNRRPINYAALSYCMTTLAGYVQNYAKSNENNRIQIHCPKLGTGHSGGSWKFISELIEDTWGNIRNIFVYPNF